MYYIYRITNKLNGKTYIGQHKYKDLNDKYMGSGVYLRRAQKKYGIENFEKEILYSCIQYKETADDMERFAIAKERAICKAEYNIADGGQGGALRKGMPHSEETKRKIGEKSKGRHCSEETKRKHSEAMKAENNPMYGKHRSEETRKKISEARKGYHHSEESKKKMSEARKGKKLSEETRQKLSKALKGRSFSVEHNRKHSEAMKGKHWKLVDGKRIYY